MSESSTSPRISPQYLEAEGGMSRENFRDDLDVVVIGAGIAGLVVANRLIQAGLRCQVLERHNRVGGRLLTYHNKHGTTHDSDYSEKQGYFDLGATWFWPGETRVAASINELRVPTHTHHLAGNAMYHAPGGAQRINGNPIDVVSGRFSHGTASLTERLAKGLGGAVSLGVTVSRIEQQDSKQHDSKRHDNTLIVTDTSGSVTARIGPLREIHDMSGVNFESAALFGFVPLGPNEPAPHKENIINQLVEIFGPEASSPLEILIKDWRTDAHTETRGLGERPPMETYAHPLYQKPFGDGRIHWALTETAPISPGHIEGAIAAAERAVATITQ